MKEGSGERFPVSADMQPCLRDLASACYSDLDLSCSIAHWLSFFTFPLDILCVVVRDKVRANRDATRGALLEFLAAQKWASADGSGSVLSSSRLLACRVLAVVLWCLDYTVFLLLAFRIAFSQ